MTKQLDLPLSWLEILLVILPGIAAVTLRLIRIWQWRQNVPSHFLWSDGVLVIICLFLVGLSLLWQRRLTVWSLTAVGILIVTVGPTILDLLLPVSNNSPSFSYSWLYGLLGFIFPLALGLFIFWQQKTYETMTHFSWALLALTVPLIFLLSLPIAIGLLAARWYGRRAVLVLLPGLFWVADTFLDLTYGILIWTSNEIAYTLLALIPAILFLIMTPVLFLRARSKSAQYMSLLAPILIGLAGVELWRYIIFAGTGRGPLLLSDWILFAAFVVQCLLALAVAMLIYQLKRPSLLTTPI